MVADSLINHLLLDNPTGLQRPRVVDRLPLSSTKRIRVLEAFHRCVRRLLAKNFTLISSRPFDGSYFPPFQGEGNPGLGVRGEGLGVRG